MNPRGAVLLEIVVSLAILVGVALTVSGALHQATDRVDRALTEAEAHDLARTALALIEIGELTPEAADRLGSADVAAMLDDSEARRESRFELSVETGPADRRELALVTVHVVRTGSELALASASQLVDLDRARGGGP